MIYEDGVDLVDLELRTAAVIHAAQVDDVEGLAALIGDGVPPDVNCLVRALADVVGDLLAGHYESVAAAERVVSAWQERLRAELAGG